MDHRIKDIIISLTVLFTLVLLIFSFSSYTATDCIVKILGGEGTTDKPLQLLAEGNQGLGAIIYDNLPFDPVSPIEISYSKVDFYLPYYNVFFNSNLWFFKILYLFVITAIPLLALKFILKRKHLKTTFVRRDNFELKNWGIRVFLFIFLLFLASILFSWLGSMSSSNSTAHIISGTGTIKDPIIIMINGKSGIMGFIDILLPFKSFPTIESNFSQYTFFVPGFNDYFFTRPILANSIYIILIMITPIVLSWVPMRFQGYRLKLNKIKE